MIRERLDKECLDIIREQLSDDGTLEGGIIALKEVLRWVTNPTIIAGIKEIIEDIEFEIKGVN